MSLNYKFSAIIAKIPFKRLYFQMLVPLTIGVFKKMIFFDWLFAVTKLRTGNHRISAVRPESLLTKKPGDCG